MFPSCANVEKSSYMALFLLATVALLLTFSILLNYNSAVILNRTTDPPRLRNLHWTSYFGILGVLFSLEFYGISSYFIDILKRIDSWILFQVLVNECSTRCDQELDGNGSENVYVEILDSQDEENLEEVEDHKEKRDKTLEIWSIIATGLFLLSIFSVLLQKFLLVFYVMQEIPVFGVFFLYVSRNGPSSKAKLFLLLGVLFNWISWVSTNVLREIVDYFIKDGRDYPAKMCIVPPFIFKDPTRGWASWMDLVSWIGIASYFLFYWFIKVEFKRNLDLEIIDAIQHVQRTFDITI